MPITNASSAPLFAVVGATGTLGGSVIKALQASSRPYRVRGICRDTSKPAAREMKAAGVQLMSVNTSTVEGARQAFDGADIVFGLTITNYGLSSPSEVKEYEVQAGRAQMDGAAAAGVKTMVWSGLPNHAKLTKTGHKLDIFDSKAEVTEYGRGLDKFRLIDADWNNIYAMFAPFAAETLVPVCDMPHDYGRYVVAAIEQDGKGLETLYTGKYISYGEIATTLAKVTGKNIQFMNTDPATFKKNLSAAAGSTMAECITEMLVGFEKNGYICTKVVWSG